VTLNVFPPARIPLKTEKPSAPWSAMAACFPDAMTRLAVRSFANGDANSRNSDCIRSGNKASDHGEMKPDNRREVNHRNESSGGKTGRQL
jgi:hypothetical protein